MHHGKFTGNAPDSISLNEVRLNPIQAGLLSCGPIANKLGLAVQKDISQHCANQSGYIMTASLDRKDHSSTYLISIQFR